MTTDSQNAKGTDAEPRVETPLKPLAASDLLGTGSRLTESSTVNHDAQPTAGKEETLWVGRTDWRHFAASIALGSLAALAVLIVAIAWLPSGSIL